MIMGSCPDATLIYGVDIGDGEDGFGTLAPTVASSIDVMDHVDWIKAWFNRFEDEDRDEDADDPGFSDALIRALAERSGWTDTETGLLDVEHVRQHLDVEVICYGHRDWPTTPWILTATGVPSIGTMNAGPVMVSPADLTPAGLREGAQKLLAALALLGLTTTRQPCWLLVADYG